MQLRAVVLQGESPRDVSSQADWKSLNPAVATVATGAQGGLAIGVKAGETQISVSFSGMTATVRFAVTNDRVVRLRITPDSVRLNTDAAAQMTAIADLQSGAQRQVTDSVVWTSDTPDLVGVNHLGVPGLLVAGSEEGSTRIVASLDGQQAAATATVLDENKLTLIIEPDALVRRPGETANFRALGLFPDGTQRNLTGTATWFVSDARVASMARGMTRCLSEGTVTIVASIEGVSATATLRCQDVELSLLRLSPQETQVPSGTRIQYTATAFFSDGSSRDVTTSTSFSSLDSNVAAVTNRGLATANSQGKAIIEGRFEGAMGQATLVVQ